MQSVNVFLLSLLQTWHLNLLFKSIALFECIPVFNLSSQPIWKHTLNKMCLRTALLSIKGIITENKTQKVP